MKAALFNLILYTKGDALEVYFKQLIRQVRELFPCRIFFNQIKPGTVSPSPPVSPPEVAEDCHLIPLVTDPSNWEKIPLQILSALIPDIPIYLLWGDDLCSDSPLQAPLE